MATLNNIAFARLRWDIFGDISQIQIADGPSSLLPALTPFSKDHPLALELATQPPLTELFFHAQTLIEYEGEWDDPVPEGDEEITRPATSWYEFRIRRSDEGPVLVGDVVKQLELYFQILKGNILTALTPIYNVDFGRSIFTPIPDGTSFYFENFVVDNFDVGTSVGINLFYEGRDQMNLDDLWKDRAKDFVIFAQGRLDEANRQISDQAPVPHV